MILFSDNKSKNKEKSNKEKIPGSVLLLHPHLLEDVTTKKCFLPTTPSFIYNPATALTVCRCSVMECQHTNRLTGNPEAVALQTQTGWFLKNGFNSITLLPFRCISILFHAHGNTVHTLKVSQQITANTCAKQMTQVKKMFDSS